MGLLNYGKKRPQSTHTRGISQEQRKLSQFALIIAEDPLCWFDK